MTLAELLENVVFAATLDSYTGASLNNRDVEAHAHLVARLALIDRYSSDGLEVLFYGERGRVSILLRALTRLTERGRLTTAEAKYLWGTGEVGDAQ